MDAISFSRPPVDTTMPSPAKPNNVKDAAQQFEALLLTQMLHSVRESGGGGGWLGSGGDSTGDSATDFAEQQLASTLAQSGGFGLGKLISTQLGPQH